MRHFSRYASSSPIGGALAVRLLLCWTLIPLMTWSAWAQQARTALVMGVWDYGSAEDLPSLPGVDDDVAAMREKLTELGFEVTTVSNPTLGQAEKAVEDFGARLKSKGGVGLFYFSGHGAEFEGTNYLLPTNVRLTSNRDLRDAALNANRVLNRMEESGAPVNLIFLDCCRNSLSKSAGTSLAPMQAKGVFVGFATASQKVAQAARGGSLYTKALVQRLGTPGLSITDMHTLVTRDVQNQAGGSSQTPFQYSGLNDLFFLKPLATRTAPSADPVPIFNGRNLAGWKVPEPNPWWTVSKGILIGRNDERSQGNILETEKVYRDVVVEVEARWSGDVDSGILLRRDQGWQCQIGVSRVLRRDMTGSVYAKSEYAIEVRDVEKVIKPGDWNRFRIEARGDHYKISLNGKLVVNQELPGFNEPGPIGLQIHPAAKNMKIEFRNIRAAALD